MYVKLIQNSQVPNFKSRGALEHYRTTSIQTACKVLCKVAQQLAILWFGDHSWGICSFKAKWSGKDTCAIIAFRIY